MKTKKKKENSNIINIKEIMHQNAFVRKGNKKIKLKISPSAIKEMKTRIIESIEENTQMIAERVYDENKKRPRLTIMVKYNGDEPLYDDITKQFGLRESKIINGSHMICTTCLRKIGG